MRLQEESIPQSIGKGADDFAVPRNIGQDDAGDANRHIAQVAALAIALKPSTFLSFHRAMVQCKY